MKSLKKVHVARLKKLVFLICLLPLMRLIWLGFNDELGANPVEFVEHSLGYWALFILLVTLSMTPIKILTKASWVLQFKRMLGLFMFFYACLHLLTYVVLDYAFLWDEMLADIVDHPYIIVGLLSFVLTIPLAVTSNNYMQRKLGKKWITLHKTVYLIAIFGVLHFLWLVKRDIREPMLFAFVLAILFAIRWYNKRPKSKTKTTVRPSALARQSST